MTKSGRVTAMVQNARIICPTPHRNSYGREPTAEAGAAALTRKCGFPWEAYECICHRFHVRRTETVA